MKRWEYRRQAFANDVSQAMAMEELNRVGAEGWEVVHISDAYEDGRLVSILMKREMQSA